LSDRLPAESVPDKFSGNYRPGCAPLIAGFLRSHAGCKFSGNFSASYTHRRVGKFSNRRAAECPRREFSGNYRRMYAAVRRQIVRSSAGRNCLRQVFRGLSPCVFARCAIVAIASRAELPGASSQGIFRPHIRTPAPEIFRSSVSRSRLGEFSGNYRRACGSLSDFLRLRAGRNCRVQVLREFSRRKSAPRRRKSSDRRPTETVPG
jgi:hypothetical protein